MIALFVYLFTSTAYACDVLFIDLNNSLKEATACQNGILDANPKNQSDDDIAIVGIGHTVDIDSVIKKIREWKDKHHCLDSVVISGHDGSGRFFGVNGSLTAEELNGVFTSQSLGPYLKTVDLGMLWGCYTDTDQSCQNQWIRKISPNLSHAIGFPVGAPSNKRENNAELLNYVCNIRRDFARVRNEEDLNKIFYGLPHIGELTVGICTDKGVCSDAYGRPTKDHPSCFHSYEELMARCPRDFDPSGKLTADYDRYLDARLPGYENPPPDEDDPYVQTSTPSKLRDYYNKVQLWRHCAEEFRDRMAKRGSTLIMPDPGQLVRLLKFDTVKHNYATIEKPEIDSYNQKLHSLGLDKFRLDPDAMNRAQIVAATAGAVSALQDRKWAQNRSSVDPSRVLLMAQGFDQSLHQLDPNCTDFSLVHEGAAEKDPCVVSYEGGQ